MIEQLFFGDIRRLNHIRRYSSYPVLRQENVAEHSFWVTYTAYMISLELRSKGLKVDSRAVIEKSILHDIEEAQTGDIVRTFKYANSEILTAIKETENKLMLSFSDKQFPKNLREDIVLNWSRSKDDSLEGQIVAYCDVLCALIYCVEEIRLGNSFMRDVLNAAQLNLDKFSGTFLDEYVCTTKKIVLQFTEK